MTEQYREEPQQKLPRPLGGIVYAKQDYEAAIEAAILTDIERAKQGLGSGKDIPPLAHLKSQVPNL